MVLRILLRYFLLKNSLASSSDNVKKALISFTVEQVLLDVGKTTLDEVGNRLYEKYRSYFHDCLEHPEYLKDVLQEIFGAGHSSITEKIHQKLFEFEEQEPIANFLYVISK